MRLDHDRRLSLHYADAPTASISSMKMIQGLFFFAWLETSHEHAKHQHQQTFQQSQNLT